MTGYSLLSTLISPLIKQFEPKSVLIVGETAQNCYCNQHNTQVQTLRSPLHIEQLSDLHAIDLAIISDVTETLNKAEATQWLGMLRNRYAAHIILISGNSSSTQVIWQLDDYLALGMKQIETTEHHTIFSYAIENYQRKKEWLNSRFWANPEMFDKHRW